ncbi:hypothetical protein ACHAXT_006268 [Thalassiosira profunda]
MMGWMGRLLLSLRNRRENEGLPSDASGDGSSASLPRRIVGGPAARWGPRRALALPVVVGVYLRVERGVSNHKLIDGTLVAPISIAMTLVALALGVFGVGVMRCIVVGLRARAGRPSVVGARGEGASPRSRNGRRALAAALLSTVAVASHRSLAGCGAPRTLTDASGNAVHLCVEGGSRAPPWRFLMKEVPGRFLGDTFLFRVEDALPHLDWRTAVLETDRCRAALQRPKRNLTTPLARKNNATWVAAEIGPSPEEVPWQVKPERGSSSFAPFRVSNEVTTPDALEQADVLTRNLKDCRMDRSSRVEISYDSSRDPLVLRANSQTGIGTLIVLSASNVADGNVYHVMHMDPGLRCLFVALENAQASSDAFERLHVALPTAWANPVGNSIAGALARAYGADVLTPQYNGTYLRRQTYRSIVDVHGPYMDALPRLLGYGSAWLSGPMWDSFKFESGRVPSSFGIAYADAVRRGNRMRLPSTSGRRWSLPAAEWERVLVVQRRKDRRLVGSTKGTFSEIVDAMCGLGLPVDVVEFEAMSIEDQIQAASTATVVVAAHGAGMSHAAWMRPGTAVVEVLFRQGSEFVGSDYHKADFANLARFYGKKYVYYDSVSLLPKGTEGLLAERMVVHADELAQVVYCLFGQAQGVF